MFLNVDQTLFWINNAMVWYVVGLLGAIGIAQYLFGALNQTPSREALKTFALIQVAACILYFVGVAWGWLMILNSVDIRSLFGQIVLVISATIINASVLMLVRLWLVHPRK